MQTVCQIVLYRSKMKSNFLYSPINTFISNHKGHIICVSIQKFTECDKSNMYIDDNYVMCDSFDTRWKSEHRTYTIENDMWHYRWKPYTKSCSNTGEVTILGNFNEFYKESHIIEPLHIGPFGKQNMLVESGSAQRLLREYVNERTKIPREALRPSAKMPKMWKSPIIRK